MPELRYPEYRDYTENRTTVNNSMMALLAGSRLAGNTLKLTAGSQRPLSELFPAVEHIGRFNLRNDLARDLLLAADHHLASVAVPYALATHEDFVLASIEMLRKDGVAILTNGKPIKAWNMHQVLFSSAAYLPPSDWLECFDLLREMRNATIHAGGRPQPSLANHIAGMSTEAIGYWTKLNDQPPSDVVVDGRLKLIAEHIFSAFAITKRLGREVNAAITKAINVQTWAKIAVHDFNDSTTRIRNSSAWRRGLIGFARSTYEEAGLTESDLETAARSLGIWTIHEWR